MPFLRKSIKFVQNDVGMSHTIKQPLSALQIELLELFAREVSNQDLLAIKEMVSHFFAQKAIAEADALWEENGYSDETMEVWLNYL